MTPAITAVVTSYNHERTLRRAIESALAQDVADLEVVVVDDASSDGSRAILEGFRGSPRLRLDLGEVNRGISKTFNRGLELARGRFVAYLGSDDYWLPGHLAGARALLEASGAALVYGRVRVVDAEDRDVTPEAGLFGSAPDEHFFEALLQRSNFVPFVSAVMRRALAIEAGGFDESLVTLQDYDLWLRIAARHPVRFRDEVTAAFRWDGENASRKSPENSQRFRRELASILEKALRELPGPIAAAGLERAVHQRIATTWARLARRQAEPADRAQSYGHSLAHAFRPATFAGYWLSRLRAALGPA